MFRVISDGKADVLRQKIENGANLNIRRDPIEFGNTVDNSEETLLQWAAKNRQYECMEVLLKNGVDVNARTKDKYEYIRNKFITK